MMQKWFEKAKLGIFIHWGIYAVGRRGGESWPLVRNGVSYDDYMKEMKAFTADQYDPYNWAEIIAESGAKYAVLTTKHHDGVTLWPTNEQGPCIPRDNQMNDLVAPYLEAVRAKGLKAGLYFSHTDWSHLNHFEVITGLSQEEIIEKRGEMTPFNPIWTQSFADEKLQLPKDYEDKWSNFPSKGTSIKGIRNEIKSITIVGNELECTSKRIGGAPWLNVPGTLWISLPEEGQDETVTVVKITLEGKLDLYNGLGVEIDVN